jgi:hypothetical protein
MEGAIEAKHQVEKSSVGGEENQLLHGLLCVQGQWAMRAKGRYGADSRQHDGG